MARVGGEVSKARPVAAARGCFAEVDAAARTERAPAGEKPRCSSFYNQLNEIAPFFVDVCWSKRYSGFAMKKFTLTFALLCAGGALAYAGPQPMTSKEIAPVAPPPTSCFEGFYFGIHGGGLLTEFDSKTSAFEISISDQDTEDDFDSTRKRHGDST